MWPPTDSPFTPGVTLSRKMCAQPDPHADGFGPLHFGMTQAIAVVPSSDTESPEITTLDAATAGIGSTPAGT